MSPKNKKKLEIIRSKLDKLDNKLLSLIKFRTNLVKEVLKLKEFKKEIVVVEVFFPQTFHVFLYLGCIFLLKV